MPVENPAPPRPRRFDGLHLVDDPVGPLREAFLDGLVAAEFDIAVDLLRAHAEAAGDDLDFIGMGDEPRHSSSVRSPRLSLDLLR